MLREARENAGLTQDELAYRLNCDRSTLSRYESKGYAPSDVIVQWSIECNSPELTFWYCRNLCSIGRTYSYNQLNAIDDSLPAVILTGIEEYEEALVALKKFRKLMQNKDHVDDLTRDEKSEAEEMLQQFIHDVSRYTDIAKIVTGKKGFDMSNGVKKNNEKVVLRGYIKENSPSYRIA